ncbi:PP2C family protein-serine/threonine phosphatase [Roseofilum casamattae]|uniref:Serine/threonine-protein phosphatase n=1 Tax=Roseofilum casamattae BLCC-M143 TaxID=3022442 RepID=A0ABT7BXB8_9CYAN|nr:serine/threonine-protein phosphatase [Roseofilum casamattae]MDJ1183838.1 serine/threonine-protein phosphatase [Roseofilum casamattae BLCC-M143]
MMNQAKCYLWAVNGANVPVGDEIDDRYRVVSPQVWEDTQPEQMPLVPNLKHSHVAPYLHLSTYHLHLPQLYGAVKADTPTGKKSVILLDNAPIATEGILYPSITDAWSQATPVRQVYWLWQMAQLWKPLLQDRVADSLLVAENIRVQGWRVWLRELQVSASTPTLEHLWQSWQPWIESAPPDIRERLVPLCKNAIAENSWNHQLPALNRILLELAAELPLQITTAGGSETGPVRSHNEDSCYPRSVYLSKPSTESTSDAQPIPKLAIVCDGLDGHEGGEVASELAARSLTLQVQGLLVELGEQTEIVSPDVCIDHITSVIRIVNNVISTQNDLKERTGRERMGTTLVMALQIAQNVRTELGLDFPNAGELYLAHVGDSRAYWITPHYCQLLTRDDHLAHWQVQTGEAAPRQARNQEHGAQLMQALGTEDANGDRLTPHVQRFILEEDGILLLCSDGLSDRGWIEQCWQQDIDRILQGEITLEDSVRHWLELGCSDENPDNLSVVLMYCRVSPQEGIKLSKTGIATEDDSSIAAAQSAPFFAPESPEVTPKPTPQKQGNAIATMGWTAVVVFLILSLLGGAFGIWYWGFRDRTPSNLPEESQ